MPFFSKKRIIIFESTGRCRFSLSLFVLFLSLSLFSSFLLFFFIIMSTTKILLKGWDMTVKKATLKSTFVPKEKHVRKMIQGNTGKHPLPELMEALNKRMSACRDSSSHLKCLYCIHRCLRESSSEFITQLKYRSHMLQLAEAAPVSPLLGSNGLEFMKQYARYLFAKVESFRELKVEVERNPDHCKDLDEAHLLKALPPLQAQLGELVRLARFTPLAHSGFSIVLACFQLVLKDAFKLFNALNIGMIALLDLYFSMPLPRAQKALQMYTFFVSQTRHMNEFFGQCSAFCRDLPKLNLPSVELIRSLEQYILDKGGDLPQSAPSPSSSPHSPASSGGRKGASGGPSKQPSSSSGLGPSGGSSSKLPSHLRRAPSGDAAGGGREPGLVLSPMEQQMIEHQRAQQAQAARQHAEAESVQERQLQEIRRREEQRHQQQLVEHQRAQQLLMGKQIQEPQRVEQVCMEQQRLQADQLRLEQQMALAKQQQLEYQLKQQISQQHMQFQSQPSSGMLPVATASFSGPAPAGFPGTFAGALPASAGGASFAP